VVPSCGISAFLDAATLCDAYQVPLSAHCATSARRVPHAASRLSMVLEIRTNLAASG
jgi:L-alanine-DL-glutamate epimerase-like enolase superfamily enzyme